MRTPEQEVEYYKNLDLTNAVEVRSSFIETLQARKLEAEKAGASAAQVESGNFDADIVDWMSKQDISTKKAVNNMIRQVMAVGHV